MSSVESDGRSNIDPRRSDVPSADFRAYMGKVRDGDALAICQLLEQFGPLVLRAVRRNLDPRLRSRYDSLDFVQGVWASVFRRPSCLARLESPADAVRFLKKVARNKVVDAARKAMFAQKRDVRRECSFGVLAEEPNFDPDLTDRRQARPSELAHAQEQWRNLVASQPTQFQQIPLLRCLGNTYEEIASTVGVHERTVRKVIRRLSNSLNR